METKIVTQTITNTFYIAKDGMEFIDEKMCKYHENILDLGEDAYEHFDISGMKFKVPYVWFHNLCKAIAEDNGYENIEDGTSLVAETMQDDTVYEMAEQDGALILEYICIESVFYRDLEREVSNGEGIKSEFTFLFKDE